MTLLIVFCNFPKFISIMASNAVKGQSSISLSHDILDRQPEWSRCNSFSSSSNDSAIFCNNRHDSSFSLVKRKERSGRGIERNRNSSGSSASSSLSYFSDKDNKKTSATISNLIATVGKNDDLERLSCPEIGTSTIELQHETSALSCSDSVLPFRKHNLRKKIRIPKCGCNCANTERHTTFVMRRFQEIGQKTVKEETVISSTKVQTCIKNNATQELHKVTYEKSYSPSKSDGNRKRRSEVEKLYDSLHEIEWAKNFSPDNILRQIHIRQAASCSMFGRSPVKQCDSPSKKQKVEQDVKSNSPENSGMPQATPQNFRSTRSSTFRNRSRQRCNRNADSSSETVGRRRRNIQRNEGSNSSAIVKEQNNKNDNFSELNFIKSSVECLELKENFGKLNIKQHINIQNCSMDCKLISNSVETIGKSALIKSNFELPNSIATLIPRNYGGPEIDNMELTSEYSLTPTFFDIAEEGIRTIDACFREVGAEVVISTCYEGDSDLPLLTSVKESNVSEKVACVDDCPPVLEPCISYQVVKAEDSDGFKSCQFQKDCLIRPCEGLFAKALCDVGFLGSVPEIEFDFTGTYEVSVHNERSDSENKSILNVVKTKDPVEVEIADKNDFKMPCLESGSLCKNNSLIQTAGKRILNKYLRILRTKGSDEVAVKQYYISKKDFVSPVKRDKLSPESSSEDVEGPSTLEAENVECHTVVKTSDQKVYLQQSPEIITFNHSKSRFYTYSKHNREPIGSMTSKDVTNKTLIMKNKNSNNKIGCLPFATTPLPARKENEGSSEVEGTKLKTTCLSYNKDTIFVNINSGFAQVIMKYTHFTVESLRELKEILHDTDKDERCHSLILMGVKESFSLGLDLRPLRGPHRTKEASKMAVAVKDFIEALSAFKKPLVAVVTGAAYGLAMTVLNHADTIIASEKATFCMPQTRLGYFPEGGATFTLPKAVGSTVAMDLIVRGRVITAQEALSIGLISEVYEEKSIPKDLVSKVKVLTRNTLQSMETTKSLMKMHLHPELLTVLENEVKLLPQMWLSDSCQKAMANEIGLL